MPYEVTNDGAAPPKRPVPPMPYEAAKDGAAPSERPVPPMPSEVARAHTRTKRPAAGVFRMAMSPLRKMMRRVPRHV